MRKRLLNKTALTVLGTVGFIGFFAFWAYALTTPSAHLEAKYDGAGTFKAVDFRMADDGTRGYSGGLDIVYAKLDADYDGDYTNDGSYIPAWKSRGYLKCEDSGGTDKVIRLKLYDYLGNEVDEASVDLNGTYTNVYAQGVKYDDANDKVWFSCTSGNSDGKWFSVDFHENGTAGGKHFGSTVTDESAAATRYAVWETEWNSAGTQFFAEKDSTNWGDPHAIFAMDNGTLKKVAEVGGYSCGFALDDSSNLWAASYTGSGQQYLYMFTASDVAGAISDGTYLDVDEGTGAKGYDVRLELPVDVDVNGTVTPEFGFDGTGTAVAYYGTSDVECDPNGDVYVTVNATYSHQGTTRYGKGYVVYVSNQGTSTDTGDMKVYAELKDYANEYDWLKAMAYDGTGTLATGGVFNPANQATCGNRLYVDMDYGWGSGGPDDISCLVKDDDSDSDGWPDGVDNAPYESNASQKDTDRDMYGNVVDGDFDNDGTVESGRGEDDLGIFDDDLDTPNKPLGDLDEDGDVDGTDRTVLTGMDNDTVPFDFP